MTTSLPDDLNSPLPDDLYLPEAVPLGPCCACAQQNATTLCLVSLKAPTPGKGWGCLQCGLANDGALVVLCDECAERIAELVDMRMRQRQHPTWAMLVELQSVCTGSPELDGRTPVNEFDLQPFDHNFAMHPETEWICKGCGCTCDRACMTKRGPCCWVEPGLCSACVPATTIANP